MNERTTMGGTDGFRGQYTVESGPAKINAETFANLSASLALHVKEQYPDQPIVVGMDTRPSGPILKQAVINGVYAAGMEPIDLGEVPTPVAQRTAQLLGAAATIVVTASHNKASDNGWKGMIGSAKPTKDEVSEISDRYWNLIDEGSLVASKNKAALSIEHAAKQCYIEDVTQDIELAFGEKPLAGKFLIVDGAYGPGGLMTAATLKQLGAEVFEYACEPSRGVINNGCGAADLAGLRRFMRMNPEITHDPNFLGAVANDGDADRVMAVGLANENEDTSLVTVDGNHMLWAMAGDQPGVVGTLYTNSGLREALRHTNTAFEECDNGDIHVTQALLSRQAQGEQWTRGGEFTGHLVDTDWLSSGDGIRMAAWMAAWSATQEMTFGEQWKALPLWHEQIQAIKISAPSVAPAILSSSHYKDTLGEMEQQNDVRIIVRKSGTEPVIRVWAEGKEPYMVSETVKRLGAVVQQLSDVLRP